MPDDEFDNCTKTLMTNLVDKKTLDNTKNKLKSYIFESLETSSERNRLLSNNYKSFYGVNYLKEYEKAIDELTPGYIRELAKYYFSQPSLYLISGNKNSIETNQHFLTTLGEIVE